MVARGQPSFSKENVYLRETMHNFSPFFVKIYLRKKILYNFASLYIYA